MTTKFSRLKRTVNVWLLWLSGAMTLLLGSFAVHPKYEGPQLLLGVGALAAALLLIYEYTRMKRESLDLGYPSIVPLQLSAMGFPMAIGSLIPAAVLSSLLPATLPEHWRIFAMWLCAAVVMLIPAYYFAARERYKKFLPPENKERFEFVEAEEEQQRSTL